MSTEKEKKYDVSDSTILVLEELRRYLDKQGCKDPKIAALHCVRLVYDDLLLNFEDKIKNMEKRKDE